MLLGKSRPEQLYGEANDIFIYSFELDQSNNIASKTLLDGIWIKQIK